jgi:hypothetical protein
MNLFSPSINILTSWQLTQFHKLGRTLLYILLSPTYQSLLTSQSNQLQGTNTTALQQKRAIC